MNVSSWRWFNLKFERRTDEPVRARAKPVDSDSQRKRASWVARAITAGQRRELRRRLKEQQHGNP